MTDPVEPFRDPGLPVADRVADLLRRLTLREKVGELNQRLLGWWTYHRDGDVFTTGERLDQALERHGGIGAVYGLQRADAWSGRDWHNGVDAEHAAEVAALVQERIVAGSRLGIPALFVEEAPHGHQALGSQLMPTNLGAAATWRPELLEAAAAHVATELRARGAHLALVSGLDLLRDPRWGRGEECFGEDPLLAAAFTRALVRGMQGVPGIGVVLKHFAGQGAGIGGRNGSGAPIGPRELAEIHLPAARAGVDEGAVGVMAAYNDLDGIPCLANERLLTGILRDEWGFDGLVMADMGAIDRLAENTGTEDAAGRLALRAGVDLSLIDRAFLDLDTAVEAGLLDEAVVDRAAARVLGVKIRLGLLDPVAPLPSFPAPDPQPELALAMPVLLENRGLPLASAPSRIAVLGPNADDLHCMLGDYVPPLRDGIGTTVLAGVRALAPDAVVTHEAGTGRTAALEGGLERAVGAARDADLAILVLGGTSERRYDDEFEDNGAAAGTSVATSGEGFDLRAIDLPRPQVELAEAVAATGTPLVIVVIAGRPHGVGAIAGLGSLLFAWYPGPHGGRAIAELVLTDREPVGRLPVSFASRSDQLPVAYDERLEHSYRYVDGPAEPDHPFGFGLGYTEWALGAATASGAWPAVTVEADLANVGARGGSQTVQLYARARVPGITPRRAVLVGWSVVELDAGAHQPVRIAVDPDAIPALGDPRAGVVELWLSTSGAGEPVDAVRVEL